MSAMVSELRGTALLFFTADSELIAKILAMEDLPPSEGGSPSKETLLN
jgi:hypothetical protein